MVDEKKKDRVFSGARPTGRQHLGNYLGAIQNYVALQEDYDCIYCIVDLHALTTVEDTLNLRQNTLEMTLDFPLRRISKANWLQRCYAGLSIVHRSGIFGTSDILGDVSGGADWMTAHVACTR